MKSNKEKVYDLLVDNPNLTNSEIEEILEEFKDRRLVETNVVQSPKFKYYEEMLEIYMNDFRSCENFQTRVKVGQEIRLLIKEM